METGGAGAFFDILLEYILEERNFAVILYVIAVLIGLVVPAVDDAGA
ncbi:MAG: hypothetical protein IT364_06140 [Candidatus Hydrogenedentes bacterium]|nr:hypothetical protein [Candidatus Hydrogenedentota bacterium]